MRILFHKEVKATKKSLHPYLYGKWENNVLQSKYGTIFVEGRPCTRTIRTENKFYRLNFPYIQYLINYTVTEENGVEFYHYHGLDQRGLRMYYSTSPLIDINQKVFLPFMDAYNLGLICTPHQYDMGFKFKTIKELVEFSISVYWGMRQHETSIMKIWKNKSVEDLLDDKILGSMEKISLSDSWYGHDLKSAFIERIDRIEEKNMNIQNCYRPKPTVKSKIFKNKLLKNFKK
jgi:hypothetical protein